METVDGIARSPSPRRPATADSPFVRACRGEQVPRVPVWFMRQAGRSLPEYRALREGISMLDTCKRPDLIVEITMQPVRRYGVDAAILYSDIMVPLEAIGVDLDIVPNVGPVIAKPVRSAADLEQLRPLEGSDVPYVTTAVSDLVTVLGTTPLIGFAGAPFTLASYLVEGGPSKDHAATKALMHAEPDLWHALLERLAVIAAGFLRVQIEAGVSAVQLFDSWAGTLAPADYQEFVAPHSRAVFAALADLDVPRIHFGVGTGELLGLMAATGPDVMGVDWRVPLHEASGRVGDRPVQGNLDPAILLAPWPVVQEQARRVLASGSRARSHIFNLGHGVLPRTDPDQLARLTEFVHAWRP